MTCNDYFRVSKTEKSYYQKVPEIFINSYCRVESFMYLLNTPYGCVVPGYHIPGPGLASGNARTLGSPWMQWGKESDSVWYGLCIEE